MPVVIDLPDNQHATLRTSDELSNRMVKELRRAARKVGLVGQHLKDLGLDELSAAASDDDTDDATEPDEAATAERNARALAILTQIDDQEDNDLDLFQRTAAAIRIVDWTLDLPIPTTADDVDNLPRPIYEALTTEAAKLDLNESFSKEADLAAPKVEEPPLTEDSNASESS